MIGAGQLEAWVEPAAVDHRPGEAEARAAATEWRGELLSWLSAADAKLAGAAAMTLALLPDIASESTPRLVAAARTGGSDLIRSGALLALARLAPENRDVVSTIEEFRRSGTAMRGVAALAWIRSNADRRFAAARSELEDLLHAERDASFPWFVAMPWFDRLAFSDQMPLALWALARSRGPRSEAELSDVAFDIGTKTKDGSVQTQATKILLGLAGFSGLVMYEGVVALLDDLEPAKRALALRIAPTDLFPSGGLGLPASGAARRRWAGLEPGGPLDELVDKGGRRVPRWCLWSAQDEPDPTEIGPALDRFAAVVEFAGYTFTAQQRIATGRDGGVVRVAV